jgi:hypothetical protein
MVGIYKKVKQLLKMVQQYSPFLNNVVPGLGTAIQTVSGIVDKGVDGANNVYNDYNSSKKDNRSYNFLDGAKSFFNTYLDDYTPQGTDVVVQTPANRLSKSYGDLHPRLKLKSGDEDD